MHELTLDEARVLGAAIGEMVAADAHAAITTRRLSPVGDEAWAEIEGIMERVQHRLGRMPAGDVPRLMAQAMTARLAEMALASAQADMDDCRMALVR